MDPFPSLQVAASHCVFSGQWERDGEREMEMDRKKEKQRVRDGAQELGSVPRGALSPSQAPSSDLSEPSSLPRRPPCPTQHQLALGPQECGSCPGHAASPC